MDYFCQLHPVAVFPNCLYMQASHLKPLGKMDRLESSQNGHQSIWNIHSCPKGRPRVVVAKKYDDKQIVGQLPLTKVDTRPPKDAKLIIYPSEPLVIALRVCNRRKPLSLDKICSIVRGLDDALTSDERPETLAKQVVAVLLSLIQVPRFDLEWSMASHVEQLGAHNVLTTLDTMQLTGDQDYWIQTLVLLNAKLRNKVVITHSH
jgi:hypothetical protein